MPAASCDKVLADYAAVSADQHALCDALEAVADSLPDQVDRQACLQLARAILPVLQRSHSFEEECLFPLLRTHLADSSPSVALLEVLLEEHEVDTALGEESSDFLMALGRGELRAAPDGIGYVLRCFFEALRRHLAHESKIVALLPSAD